MTAPAIRCVDLGFTYPDGTRALTDISFSIDEGESVAVVGQNGSGKSTLVRQLNGLLRPTQGCVQVRGRDVGRQRVAAMAREVGLAFQDPGRQIFSARVADEVAFGPRNLGRRGRELDEAVDAALAAVGLSGLDDLHPYDLGLSRRKLLGIASVLAMDTPIVVLDEPTTGQDARGIDAIRALVRDLADRGRTVIVISHDLRFVAETFPRVVVLASGLVVADGPPGQVLISA